MESRTVYRTGAELRHAARENRCGGPTAGHAPGFVQANLAILPKDWALDFFLFAQRNPKPCPLLEVVDAGQTEPALTASRSVALDPGWSFSRTK